MDASNSVIVTPCPVSYDTGSGTVIECAQHLGGPGRQKHSGKFMGLRFYWTTEEAERASRA